VQSMLSSGAIAVAPWQREMAGHVLRPFPSVPGPVYSVPSALTASLLPGSLREAYGLPASPVATRIAAAVPGLVRTVVSVAPPVARLQRLARGPAGRL
jgi:hypothetical protein